MKRFFVLFLLLALFIAGCEPPGFFYGILEPTPTPEATPTAVTMAQRVVEVSISVQSTDSAKPFEVGSTAVLTLNFSPMIIGIWTQSDGSMWSVHTPAPQRWQNHTISQVRYCVAPDKPCIDLGI